MERDERDGEKSLECAAVLSMSDVVRLVIHDHLLGAQSTATVREGVETRTAEVDPEAEVLAETTTLHDLGKRISDLALQCLGLQLRV